MTGAQITAILTDILAVLAILGLVWRASVILTTIKVEVSQVRRDVDRVVANEETEHNRIVKRLDREDQRWLDHAKEHRGGKRIR